MVVVSRFSTAAVVAAGLAPQASNSARPAADRPSPPAAFRNWRRLRPPRGMVEAWGFILSPVTRHQPRTITPVSTRGCLRRRERRHLHLELVEEMPIRALLDDLLRRILD